MSDLPKCPHCEHALAFEIKCPWCYATLFGGGHDDVLVDRRAAAGAPVCETCATLGKYYDLDVLKASYGFTVDDKGMKMLLHPAPGAVEVDLSVIDEFRMAALDHNATMMKPEAYSGEYVTHCRVLYEQARAALEAALRATPGAGEQFDFLAHLHRQREWSGRTFGPGSRAAGVVDHIRKELREIEAAPGDLHEWIDVAILALDGAWRSGASPEEIIAALVAKQTKNEAREWPDWRTAPEGSAIEHVKDATPAEPRCDCGKTMEACADTEDCDNQSTPAEHAGLPCADCPEDTFPACICPGPRCVFDFASIGGHGICDRLREEHSPDGHPFQAETTK